MEERGIIQPPTSPNHSGGQVTPTPHTRGAETSDPSHLPPTLDQEGNPQSTSYPAATPILGRIPSPSTTFHLHPHWGEGSPISPTPQSSV